jgi:hypothetical protein
VCSPTTPGVSPECAKEWRRRRYLRGKARGTLTQKTPEQTFRANLSRNYHITVERYEDLLAAQNGVCAIACCPEKAKSCGKCVRALLCTNCNCALGYAGDSPDLLIAMAAYLVRHEASERV